jgi:hypothetical protein
MKPRIPTPFRRLGSRWLPAGGDAAAAEDTLPVALTIDERLRIIGRWLDVRSARTFQLMLDPEAIQIECEDGRGQPQHRKISELRLQRMWLLARTSTRHGAEVGPGRWGPAMRALGQLLQAERATAFRIWSDGRSVLVATRGQQDAEALRYAEETLLAYDAGAQHHRRLQAAG